MTGRDPLGALLGGMLGHRPICSRCRTKPALLELGGKIFCSECSGFADGTASSGGTAAVANCPPTPVVAAAENSVGPERSGSPATAGESWTSPPAVAQNVTHQSAT